MGKLSKKYHNSTYEITYVLDHSESLNIREIMVLSNPGVTSVAPIHATKNKSSYYLTYQFNHHMELSEYLGKPMNEREFFSLMKTMVNVLTTFGYLQMEHKLLVLDEHYIFVDRSTKAITFLYLPLIQATKKYEISYFLSWLFHHLEIDDNSEIKNGYIEFIESGSMFNTRKFAAFHEEQLKKYTKHSQIPLPEFRTLPDSFFQRREEEPHIFLIRKSTNERIGIQKEVFRIGKDPQKADYVITDNVRISATHADIILKGNRYYICDNFSTNKTYLNGFLVDSQNEEEIVQGDILKLADEEFEFNVE